MWDRPAAAGATLAVRLALLAGIFLSALDMGIVAPATWRVADAFHVPLDQVFWLVSAYALAYAAALPVAGRVGDRRGRRAVYVAGLVLFGAASLASAAAPTWPALLWGRAVQGVGAAAMTPTAVVLLSETVPPSRRGRAMGWVGAVYGVASVLGPPLGGALVQGPGVPFLFGLNAPVAGAALLAARRLPADRPAAEGPVDVGGALWLSLAVGGLLWVLGRVGQAAAWAAVGIVWAGLCGIGLVRAERCARDPIVPRGLAARLLPALALGAVGGGAMTVLDFMPLYGHTRFGLAADAAGQALVPMALAATAVAYAAGRLTDRVGPARTLAAGFLCLAAAGVLIGLAPADRTAYAASLVLIGVGTGVAMGPPLSVLCLQAAARHGGRDTGQAVAALSVARAFGTSAGPVALAALVPHYPALFAAFTGVTLAAAAASLAIAHRAPGPSRLRPT
jgi:MFS family permease